MIIYSFSKKNKKNIKLSQIFKSSILDYSVILLIGSLFIGYLCGDKGNENMYTMTSSLFNGFLSIFLLAMGIEASKQIKHLREAGLPIIIFSILAPILFSILGIILGMIMSISAGNTLLLSILFGSASYIAVPAALSESIKDANIGLMVSLSLIVTFSFNICFGIPMYLHIIEYLFN